MSRHETILVVEDDIDVRLTAVDMLTQLGHRMLTVTNGQTVLDLMSSGTSIDLLSINVIIPGPIKGSELSARTAQRVPPLPALFVSGYSHDEAQHNGRLSPGVALFDEPYRRDDLMCMVCSVLTVSCITQVQAQSVPLSVGPVVITDTSQPPVVPLVENDITLREAMQEVLTTLSLQRVATANVEDVLILVRTRSVQVLLIDLTLPGQSDADLVHILLRM